MASRLPDLISALEPGYSIAVKQPRLAIKLTQPDAAARDRMRPGYAADCVAHVAVSQVAATHFAAIAEARGYRKGSF